MHGTIIYFNFFRIHSIDTIELKNCYQIVDEAIVTHSDYSL